MKSIIEQLDAFFKPKSVAVVGASKKLDKAGHVIFKNFVENKRREVFKGELYAVNPSEDYVLGYPSYPSLRKIVGDVELIVIVVPAKNIPQVMEDAAAKGVKAAVIVSAGFSEVGNKKLEDQIVAIAKKAGIRILGPNCLGVYDTETGIDMLFLPETKILLSGNEMVATPRPMSGNLAIVTQSGAFGASALDYLTGRQMGISKFVSFGNKCDVNEAETLQYLLHNEKTWVILLYAEAIETGREFMRVAREVTKVKPIVALKSGRSQAGARAAASHTGAIAGSDKVYDAAFAQVGIIRAQNMEEFFDLGKVFAFQPPATGKNIGILTDAGGPGVMAVDEIEARGLTVRRFSDELIQKFERLKEKGYLPKFATNLNPVDVTGSANSEMFETVTKILFESQEVDGILVLGLHHTPGLHEDFVDRIANVARQYIKPIVACDIGETEMALYVRSRFDKMGIPCYGSPEDAARSIAALAWYGEYLRKYGLFDGYLEVYMKRLGRRPFSKEDKLLAELRRPL
ncbi:MAG: acetate--CoA ligase family protein [Candidatus Bathyarchaeales archaeon]